MQLFKLIFLGGFFISTLTILAQDEDLSKLLDTSITTDPHEPVIASFKTTRLINLTTIEQVKTIALQVPPHLAIPQKPIEHLGKQEGEK